MQPSTLEDLARRRKFGREMIEMTDLQRPTRVVVVDADNPMNEVRGEFFWREDHERLLAVARETGYRLGYADGVVAASSQRGASVRLVRVGRRSRVAARTLIGFVVAAFLVSLVSNILR